MKFCELFTAFICANDTGSLVNNFFAVNFILSALISSDSEFTYSLRSSGSMPDKSSSSNLNFLEIVSSGCDLLFLHYFCVIHHIYNLYEIKY